MNYIDGNMGKYLVFAMVFLITLVVAGADSIFLSGYLEEGQTTVYETEDGAYVLSLLSVSDQKQKAVFRLNEEMSKGIEKGDSYVFEDGSEVVVREVMIIDADNGNDEVGFYFYGTGKSVLKLKNVSRYVLDNNLCNFDEQCLNESQENCCYDCGCEGECVNNKCVVDEEEGVVEEVGVEEKEDKLEVEVEKAEEKVVKGGDEKKVAMVIIGIILFIILMVSWKVFRKRKSIF